MVQRARLTNSAGSTTPGSLAADCRAAAVDFMAGAASAWSPRELVEWLEGPYAVATRLTNRGAHVATWPTSRFPALDAILFDEVLSRARADLMTALSGTAFGWGVHDFVRETVERGLVRRLVLPAGVELYSPVGDAPTRLFDRVRALFVAAYLDDPSTFRTLHVCPICRSVDFDASAQARGACRAHRHASGIDSKGAQAVSDEELALTRLPKWRRPRFGGAGERP